MDHFHYKNGVYHAEDVPLDRLAQDIGTPFYCYSTATLTRHYQVFSGHFPGAKICYAVKANGNLAILKTLAKLGSGADVVSEGEIRLALAAGVRAQDIVFSGVGKTAGEMAFALEKDIFQFNVESLPELELLSEVAIARKTKARIAVRVNPDVDPKTHAKIATGHKASKFGIGMDQAMAVYKRAAQLKGITVQGVSVHIGSQLTHLEPFAQAFARVRAFVGELRAQEIAIATLDLGGGLGIPYGKEELPLPDAYADIVRRETAGLNCQLIFEPGRVLAGNAGILVTRVVYVKENEGRFFVIVDAGMNDLIRPALYEAYHGIVPVIAPTGDAPTELVDVVGPVCETGDIFAEQRLLKVPKAGDLLAFRSAGAYGASMSSTYNARPLVAEVMVNGSQRAVVRRRQTYEELLARDQLPQWL
ncbi:MAG: diaminopimelate decarboxylase [Pseudomonadota bacterium]|nr:diaminopimelate decarboxylase [Pseudomonadota bacterium]